MLPVELPGLGFNLSDQQLDLVARSEDWVMCAYDVGRSIDPCGLASTWYTCDGKPLHEIYLPLCFYFNDDSQQFSNWGMTWQESLDERGYDTFWNWPSLVGVIDLPWHNHQGCGCSGEEDPDILHLWDVWPISDEVQIEVDAIATVVWENFLEDAQKLILLQEYYDEPGEELEFEAQAIEQRLFLPNGRLRLHSSAFELSELTDNADLLSAWRALRRSKKLNGKIHRAFVLADDPFEQTG